MFEENILGLEILAFIMIVVSFSSATLTYIHGLEYLSIIFMSLTLITSVLLLFVWMVQKELGGERK